nr:arachidonate 5-lipoxygenase-activating protein isoform X2 [Vulpes vulpes]
MKGTALYLWTARTCGPELCLYVPASVNAPAQEDSVLAPSLPAFMYLESLVLINTEGKPAQKATGRDVMKRQRASEAWVPPNWSSPYWGARSKHGSRSRGEYCPVGHHHPHQCGPERQNCVDAYPTFLVVLWSAGLLCSQVPAAFAGLMYLFVRQKYFVGYLGERTQSTPGYIFGKRIILFLFLMSVAGIFNYYLILFFGSDFENYIKTVSTTISPLLLIP